MTLVGPLALSLLLVGALEPAATTPPGLREAQDLAAHLRYEEAAARAKRALQEGGLRRQEVLLAYRIIAESSAAMGDLRDATDAFTSVLELDPAYELPVRASPRLVAPFGAAKAKLAGQALQLATQSGRTGEQMQVVIKVTGDVQSLLGGARVRGVDGTAFGLVKSPEESGAWEFEGRGDSYFATLLDRFGNELLVQQGQPAALPDLSAVTPPATVPQRKPVIRPATLLGTVALIAVGSGVYFAVARANTAHSLQRMTETPSDYYFRDATAAQQKLIQQNGWMWASLASTALLTPAAIVWW